MRRATAPRGATRAASAATRRRAAAAARRPARRAPRAKALPRALDACVVRCRHRPSAATMQSIGPCWKCQRPSPSTRRARDAAHRHPPAGASSGHGTPAAAHVDAPAAGREHVVEPAHARHVAAERAVIVGRIVNSIGETIAGVGTEPKLVVRHRRDVDHHRDAAAGPDEDRRAAEGHLDALRLDRSRQRDRVLGDAVRTDPPAPAMKNTVQSAGSQFWPIRSTTRRMASGISPGAARARRRGRTTRVLARRRHHEQPQTRAARRARAPRPRRSRADR